MRTLALMTLAAGVLAAAPIQASAATIDESFFFFIPSDGSSDTNYSSDTFAGFDPSLGTLTLATVTITGSLDWTPGPPFGHLPPNDRLLVNLLSPVSTSQMFSSDGSTVPIAIDLNGAAPGAFIAPGPQEALLSFRDTFGGTLSRGTLEGAITYTYTPAAPPVPEPSTWAMMAIGFAGLGYAAIRRKGAVRA